MLSLEKNPFAKTTTFSLEKIHSLIGQFFSTKKSLSPEHIFSVEIKSCGPEDKIFFIEENPLAYHIIFYIFNHEKTLKILTFFISVSSDTKMEYIGTLHQVPPPQEVNIFD